MASKLVEKGVARVEKFGGLVQKTVGSLIGSERLQERGQNHLEHAEALRNGTAHEPAEEASTTPLPKPPKATKKVKEPKAQQEQSVAATAQTSQEPEGGHPPSLHHKKTPRRQYAL